MKVLETTPMGVKYRDVIIRDVLDPKYMQRIRRFRLIYLLILLATAVVGSVGVLPQTLQFIVVLKKVMAAAALMPASGHSDLIFIFVILAACGAFFVLVLGLVLMGLFGFDLHQRNLLIREGHLSRDDGLQGLSEKDENQ